MAMENLESVLLIEWLLDAHADIFEEVAHDYTRRPNIHRLVVVLLVHDYLGGAVQSRANVSWKPAGDVGDGLVDIGYVGKKVSLQLLHVELCHRPLIINAVGDEIL